MIDTGPIKEKDRKAFAVAVDLWTPDHRTTNDYAVDEKNHSCFVTDEHAAKWCVVGVLAKVGIEEGIDTGRLQYLLLQQLDRHSLIDLNDNKGPLGQNLLYKGMKTLATKEVPHGSD